MSGVPVLRPSGEIDIAAVARLRSSWLALCEMTRPELVVVDLAEVTFMDVAGVGLLVAVRNRQQQHGGRILLRSVPAPVAKVLHLTGVSGLFPVDQTPRQREASVVLDLRVRETPLPGARRPRGDD
jgi:anti-anti-sigma factor